MPVPGPLRAVGLGLISEVKLAGLHHHPVERGSTRLGSAGHRSIYDNVVANAHPGAIVLQHDGGGDRSETLAALPQEIATLRGEGYKFVTVTQLLGSAAALSLITRRSRLALVST